MEEYTITKRIAKHGNDAMILVPAGLIARLNIAGIWTTGEGKTQLENDMCAIFGNRGFFEPSSVTKCVEHELEKGTPIKHAQPA